MKLVRLLTKALLLFFAALLIGGYFMRNMVVKRLEATAATASSVVFARPFPITPHLSVGASRLLARLKRLGYQQVSAEPTQPGQYRHAPAEISVYLRSARTSSTEEQSPRHVRLVLAERDSIQSLVDVETSRPLDRVWLESEHLSLLGNTFSRASTPKTLNQYPPQLVQAVLGTEDERFYLHYGVDPVAVTRAVVVNLQTGRIAQGGSTITQQLAKNLFFTNQRSFMRKIFEAIAALLIETAFTKEQILEFYLNEVFLGQEGNVEIHGFGEAALSFFGKDVERLSIAESGTLAGIIKAPSAYSPRRHPEQATSRRNLVLQKMKEQGAIGEADYIKAVREPLRVLPAFRSRRVAPYFVDYVSRELQPIIQSTDAGERTLQVYTGIDLEYQMCAQRAVEQGLSALEKQFPKLKRKKDPLQGALVSVLAGSGDIIAWVGGRNYGQNQFDRVSLARRQPGSAFKPFVYLTALDKSLNTYRVARTTSLLEDEPVNVEIPGVGEWAPENYDREYRGEVTVREALVNSLNVPTVNLAAKVGIPAVKRTAELFGFGDHLPEVPSLALGTGEVTPLQLTRAYAGIAHGGLLTELRAIQSVLLDGARTPLSDTPSPTEERIASEAAVFVLTDMLMAAVNHGTGRTVRTKGFTAPVAGKTGTSNDTRDAWFAGFTPHLLSVVWVGFDDNSQLGLTGGQAAAPIWAEYMKCLGSMEPELEFIPPPGVLFREVDIGSGLLASPHCPRESVVTEIFVEGTEPVTECDRHTAFNSALPW